MMIAEDIVERPAPLDKGTGEPPSHYLLRCHRIALDFGGAAARRALDRYEQAAAAGATAPLTKKMPA